MSSNDFIYRTPNLESYWRGLILFGRNTASYKFAFAKSLLELKPESGQLLKLEDIAPVFSRNLIEHLKVAPKQIISPSSSYLSSLVKNGIETVNQQKVIEDTLKLGFVNVVDAFQNIGTSEIPHKFYLNEVPINKGIRITDNFSKLMESIQFANLDAEVDSRWSLVERAWELGVTSSVISIHHNYDTNSFFSFDKQERPSNITSARGALNGYQKGKCFYCFCNINVNVGSETHVDHFFPFKLAKQFGQILNGVWNLVLACSICNGGSQKRDRIPSKNLLSRLNKRNEYLISSHHPLRETLILQTGQSEQLRKDFLATFYYNSEPLLGLPWEPDPTEPDIFE